MARPREILFVDPSVSDIDTILNGLRPGVEAIVLDPATPAARQIAAALAGRDGLSAVHIIAHGAPGRVNFASGDWSATTLEDEAENFAAIGRALAVDGELRLWSCDTGAGAAGEAFIESLARQPGRMSPPRPAALAPPLWAAPGTLQLLLNVHLHGRRSPRRRWRPMQECCQPTAFTWTGPGGTTATPTTAIGTLGPTGRPMVYLAFQPRGYRYPRRWHYDLYCDT